jgi:hypothetical protein
MSDQKVFPFRASLARGHRGVQSSERTGWLTPYEADTLFADALWAGTGSQLEVAVPEGTTDDGLYWVQQRFDRLRRRGIDVHVRRDESWRFKAKAMILAS